MQKNVNFKLGETAPSTQLWQFREALGNGARFSKFDHPKVNAMRGKGPVAEHRVSFSFKKGEDTRVSGDLRLPVSLELFDSIQSEFIECVLARLKQGKIDSVTLEWDVVHIFCNGTTRQINMTHSEHIENGGRSSQIDYGADLLDGISVVGVGLSAVKDENFVVDEHGKAPKKLEALIDILFLSYIYYAMDVKSVRAEGQRLVKPKRRFFSLKQG